MLAWFCSASKGLFRKPDWDIASGCYDRAGSRDNRQQLGTLAANRAPLATNFKLAKSYDQAVQAYVKASEAYFKAES